MNAVPTLQALACESYFSQNLIIEAESFEYAVLQNMLPDSLFDQMLFVNPGLRQILHPANEQSVTNWYKINLERMSEQRCTINKIKSPAFIAQEILQINDRSAKLSQAVARNDLIAVRALLAQGQIYANIRGMSLYSAAKMGNFEMVQVLAESGPIHDKDRMNALRIVIMARHEAAFNALLPNSMEVKERLELLVLAIESSNFNSLVSLLNLAPNSNLVIESLINAAALKNKPRALKILLANHQVSDTVMFRIGKFAEKKGHFQIAELLLKKHGYSNDTIERSI